MQRYFDVVQTTAGNAIPGALVYVYVGSTTVLATLFADNSGTAAPNPLTTNADGEYAFYAANGTYTIQIAATGYAGETKPGVVLFDPKDAGIISVKDFGAKGDGVSDDTAAIQSAINFMYATGQNIIVPPGTYISDPITIYSLLYAGQASFIGDDKKRCIFQRKTAGTSAFFTYGSSASTSFMSGVNFQDITFNGGAKTNGPAFEGYDIVRSVFTNCRFRGGSVACRLWGGISVMFLDCLFDEANRGLHVQNFASLAGGGWPNIVKVIGGEIVDNAEYGVWFDGGRSLILNGIDIEGNGTTLAASQGGVYIGPNVGQEVAITDPVSIGLICDGCWFEANRGIADIVCNSGINSVSNGTFFSQSTMVVNDIVVNGGKYRLNNINISFSKTENVKENAGVLSGNYINAVEAANLTYDPTKTTVSNGVWINLQQGRVPSINNTTAPMLLVGSDTTSANPTITFSTAFKAGTTPRVFCSVVNNGAATLDGPEVYSVTNTGFTLRKKQYNGTAITTANYTVDWFAVGESP